MGRNALRLVLSFALLVLALPAAPPLGAIIDGEPAAEGAWPTVAGILDEEDDILCGGTLISSTHVLTAAHCFFEARSGGVPDDAGPFSVVIGGADLSGEEGERIAVRDVVLHPGYDELRLVNDVAVLHLSAAAATTPQARATASQAALWAPGRTATVVGYGATQPDGSETSDTLLEASIPIVETAECAASYDAVDGNRQVCAGDPGTEAAPGKDACQGDSGGPLFVRDEQDDFVLAGIVSYGALCGVDDPGVYVQVAAYQGWVDEIVASGPGSGPGEPPTDNENPNPSDEGAAAEALRVAASPTSTAAIPQAAAVSALSFTRGEAQHAVLARADVFADALGGSSLGWGTGPLLFTHASGQLPSETREELLRVVEPGGVVYILGGSAAVPASIDDEVAALGFEPVRLAGAGREATAAVVADEVVAAIGEGTAPLDTMILATSGNWPDAVTAGQLGSWWGIPILLTPPGELHPEARAAIESHQPSTVLVIGGTAAVSDGVATQVGALGPEVIRLGGATRTGTAAEVLRFHVALFDVLGEDPPAVAVVVNLRRADAFAHVLSASMVTGGFAGVFLTLEGERGEVFTSDVADAACGLDMTIVAAGATDLVSESGVDAARAALLGQGCTPS